MSQNWQIKMLHFRKFTTRKNKRCATPFLQKQLRRFKRLKNGFSKKVENHCYAIALHFVYYNFVKIHKTLRVPPAMEAGLIKRLMSIGDIVKLAD